MAEDILELFTKYQEELKADTNIDELNMKDKALNIATLKHKWAARLIRHKIDLSKLEKQRDKAVGILCERYSKELDVVLSGPALKRKAESDDVVVEIDSRIESTKLMIDYLEKIEKVVGSMTWDLKNIIDIVKAETQ